MTKRDLIEEVVRHHPRFSRQEAEVTVNAVFESMAEALRQARYGGIETMALLAGPRQILKP